MFDGTSGPTSEFRWRVEVGDSALLSALSYALPAAAGGVGVLAALSLGRVVFAAARGGRWGVAVGAVTATLLAVLAHRWYLPALTRTDLPTPLSGRYSRRGVVLASVAGAAVLYAGLLIHPAAPVVLFVAGWVAFALVAGFPTEGRADPDEGVLVVDGTRVPLEAVRSYRAVPLGRLVFCRLSYARGVPRAPRTLVASREGFDRARSLLDGGVRERSDVATTGAVQRWIVLAFGLGFVAVGPALWVLLPSEGVLVTLYAGSVFGSLGVVFLWYAATA